ncbi:GNAT family protein [Granulicella sp. dw_53]|uniref:GNAT family N-acetyltransferase n=1 Tax=Granulicella sp. dw_53 TaxID=2719792 RepID=UPI001BD269C3|nr:GNAT family protein [Granulicella sp. dw_53]
MKPTTPTLEGPRIRLEPLTLAHLPALEQVAFDPRIWRYMNTPVNTPQDLRKWAETALALKQAGTVIPWVTILKSENKVIGSTRYMDLDLHHRTVEIGNTWLSPQYHGAHANPEAKLLQLTYAFETLNLRRVALKTHHENLQSQAAMRKLGAQYEGTFRNHYIMDNGSQRHSVWFSIIQEDWPQVKSQLEHRLAQAHPPSA